MLLDISHNHLKIVQDILRKYLSAYEVWAFGSRAKWLAKEYSDLDLCVISQYPISFNILGLLEEAFNDSDLPYKVDIVDWSTTSASFREIIKKDKVMVQKAGRMDFEKIYFRDLLVEPVRNGVYKQKEFHGRGTKIVNMGELFSYPRMFDVPMKRVYLSEKELDKSSLQVNDLLFARRSLVASGAGRCSIIKEIMEATTFESSIIRARPNLSKVASDYLYYYFSSPVGRELMGTILRQVAVSGITGTDLMALEIYCPSLRQQKEIAAILSSLDDRITLLRETNKTLEAIAQALFKSWFIDFDPVRAKMENKIPEGMDEETAALFPDSLEESELGMIPKGWNCVKFGDFVEPKKGQSITRKTITEGSIPVIAGGLTPAYYHNKSNVTAPAITVSASGANAGFVQIHHNDIWASDCSYINSKITKFVYANFVFLKLKQSEITNMQQGAAQPHIYPSDIKRLDVKKAPDILYEQYEKIVIKIFLSIATNKKQAQTLANLRDTLLPRLISGQIRV